MSSEQPFEIFTGKSKRLRSLAVFSNAIDEKQKTKFPTTIKLRFDHIEEQTNLIDEIRLEIVDRVLEPILAEIQQIVTKFPGREDRDKFSFVPTICLNVHESFADFGEIRDRLEDVLLEDANFIEIDELATTQHFLASLYSKFAARKCQPNSSFVFNDIADLYAKYHKDKPLFLLFSNPILMDARTLNEILAILTTNFRQFPVILCLPFHGGHFTLNSLLYQRVLCKLDVTTLSLPNAERFLNEFLHSLLFNKRLLKFDIRTLKLLNTEFREQFFSLKRYCDCLKLIILEHFLTEKYSTFSCDLKSYGDIFKRVKCDFGEFAVDFNRTLPGESPKKKFKELLELRVEKTLNSALLNFRDYVHYSSLLFRCFQNLHKVEKCGGIEENQFSFSLYSKFRDISYFTGDEFRSLIDSLTLEDIKSFLVSCRRIFENENSKLAVEISDFFVAYYDQFRDVDEFQQSLVEKRNSSFETSEKKNGLRKQSRQDLQKVLLEKIRHRNEFDAFEIRKKQFSKDLTEKFLQAINFDAENSANGKIRLAFNVFYSGEILARFVNFSARKSMKESLLGPPFSKGGRLINFQLDCSIIYEYYSTSGHSILAREMLKNFADNIAIETGVKKVVKSKKRSMTNIKDKNKLENEREATLARFYKILAEFEYLGLIKFAPRRKEYIARLLFTA